MRKMVSVVAFTAAWFCLAPIETRAQIQITTLPGTPADADNLAMALIGSPGVVLVDGSAKFTGFNAGSGSFTGGEDFLPFGQGIVLTTGHANELPGPNTGSGFSNPDLFSSQSVNGAITPGDAQLSKFIGDTATYNAAVLEFSFVPASDVVSFRYVFGSEEYNEFVGAPFNDIFAFFLNGSNIALIPNSQVQIRINSVNGASNSQFFTNNTLPGASLNTKLDGLVGAGQALYATGPVVAGQVNTIRLAVADVFDASFDSAVVIEAGSFIDAPPPMCGDGVVGQNEQCDDGNGEPGDGCSPTCMIEAGQCGDGTVDPGEQCDPPNGVTCDSQCQGIPIACGDGIVQPGESCDDGNTLPGDGCSPACTVESVPGVCGDATVDPGEQCDPPNGVTCDNQCQNIPIACGDGLVQPGESCDPPNGVTCDSQCQGIPIACGDGLVQPGESCDDGNTLPGDGCSPGCTVESAPGVCGDATVDPGEQCDPPNGVTCDDQCQLIPPITCGDGIVQSGEQCEPPNTATCNASCQTVVEVEFCGDAIVQSGEECDDGNLASGDGCAPDCTVEDTDTTCSDFPCGHGGRKVKICHVPPGHESKMRTICIGRSAVAAHLRNHPDQCGPCDRTDRDDEECREDHGKRGKHEPHKHHERSRSHRSHSRR